MRRLHSITGAISANVLAGDSVEAVRIAMEMAKRPQIAYRNVTVTAEDGEPMPLNLAELSRDAAFMDVLDASIATAGHTGEAELLTMLQENRAFLRALPR